MEHHAPARGAPRGGPPTPWSAPLRRIVRRLVHIKQVVDVELRHEPVLVLVEPDQQLERLRAVCRDLPADAGVYRMIDAGGHVIYVGKARNIRKRVSSYFNRQAGASPKVLAMVVQVDRIEITVTANETEALILESNLIKDLRPRYNIVLRGLEKFRITGQEQGKVYRVAHIDALPETVPESDRPTLRQQPSERARQRRFD